MLSYLISPPYPIPITSPRRVGCGWLREGLAPRLLGGRSSSSVSSKEGSSKEGKLGREEVAQKNFGENFGPKLPSLNLGGEP